MKTFSLSTFLTVAMAAFLMPNFPANAQNTNNQHTCAGLSGPALTECTRSIELENQKRLLEIEKLKKDVNLGECKDRMAEVTKLMPEFRKSCSQAVDLIRSLAPLVGTPDGTSCESYLDQCNGKGKLFTPRSSDIDPESGDDDDGRAGVGGSSASTKRSTGPSKELLSRARSCNLPGSSAFKEARDAMKDYRKERSQLEKDGREAQTDILEIANKQRSEQNKLNDRAEKMKLDFAEAQRKIMAQKKGKEQQAEMAVLQLEQDIDDMRLNVDRIRLSQQEADVALAEALGQIERQCHAEALAKVDEHRKQVIEAMKSSNYTPGGQQNLFQGVGSSMKAKFKKLASEYFKDCKDSDMTKELVRASKNRKALAAAKADAEINGIEGRIAKAEERKRQLQTTVRTDILKETEENLNALKAEVEAASNKIANARSEIGSEVGMAMMKAQQKMAFIQSDMERISADVRDDETIDSLRRKFGLGTDAKTDEIGNANSLYGSLDSASRQAGTVCCAPTDANNPKSYKDETSCRAACAIRSPDNKDWSNINCPSDAHRPTGTGRDGVSH